MSFEGKIAMITGSGRGIGRTLARHFAARGAAVIVNYAASASGAEETVREIETAGGKAIAVQADIADAASVNAMFEAAHAAFGRVDILVNNAGINIDRPFLELTEADWDRVLSVNLKGPFLCSQAAGRDMQESGNGRIVNISAVTAVDARKNAANYCSSKAGLNMLTKCMALELAPHVSVNAIALGFVDSPIVRELYSEEQLSAVVTETPLATMGTHDHVSNLVQYLASDGAEFMTGQTIILDGGRVMR